MKAPPFLLKLFMAASAILGSSELLAQDGGSTLHSPVPELNGAVGWPTE